ncbi:inactive polypeptide N-acetylgalactosaminyltransferase-like protein 5 [Ylistrum balloti]|uniref:inactive polypeptide N-acetylgalactosaminyltransferase-like protein 5 n=1 Tax=Ylistrum balloti TaxID=509963 RepID=UPI002905BD29|nr:inactive polypeptide N-acetylgalactosaminyltransferase-like protein 5 [Ylistrum balloti]
MAKSGRARRCGFLPAIVLFIVGQTWIILISLPNSPRRLEDDQRDITTLKRIREVRLGVIQDKKYTAKLDQTLQTILARHRGAVDTSNFRYNVSLGDTLSVRRPVPDNRNPECQYTKFSFDTSITVSVVTIFHNEALSTLLRTVHSVIDRSPEEILKEVILVDDASTMTYLKDDLDMYLSLVPKARVIRNRHRAGLVRSRMAGARNASGDVLVFFDAHMECNTRWLEPLLHALQEEPTAIVQPDIDIIKGKTMEYYSYEDSGLRSRGGFGWDLRYAWFEVPGFVEQALKSKMEAFVTPVLVGNAIVVRRDHFFKIGGFDEGLDIWGGEHFDLSFKNWLCAGRVLTVPCSKVGHLFKLGVQSYSFGGDRHTVILKNLMRVAEIWLDDYKDVFYRVTAGQNKIFPKLDNNSITLRKDFIKTLNCKSFSWYLKNIIPEQKVPPIDAVFYGEITNYKTSACLAVLDDNFIGMTYACFRYRIIPENSFTFSKKGEFKFENDCLFIDPTNYYLKKGKCDQTRNVLLGKWKFQTASSISKTGTLKFETNNTTNALCVTHVTGAIPKVHYKEQMAQGTTCNSSSAFQVWYFMYRLSDV